MKNRPNGNGSAAIELMAIAPAIAMFIMLIAWVGTAYREAIGGVASAEAHVDRDVMDWEIQNRNRGFRRPCLELIEPQSRRCEGNRMRIGAGMWKVEFSPSQEVSVAAEPICQP